MRKAIAFMTVLFLSVGVVATFPDSASAKKRKTYNTSASQNQRKGEKSSTCKGEAKQDSVTKGALYGAGAGYIVTGSPLGAVLGSGAGAVVQHSQNNAACGR